MPSNPFHVSSSIRDQLRAREASRPFIEGDDEDRPPQIDFIVGRDTELQMIEESAANTVFVTGLGGEGKSTVASRYFESSQRQNSFSYFVWRDCKEESERFENQLASVIEKLSFGKISGKDLSRQNIDALVDTLSSLIGDHRILFVFDNADHYVNLENSTMTAGPDRLIKTFLHAKTSSRLIFTCRPSIRYNDPSTLSIRLEGISAEATNLLFANRRADCTPDEIATAHRLTNGHAFWLDLLAVQLARNSSSVTLSQLLESGTPGKTLLPTDTLKSIWSTLSEQQQIVLRVMAESVRPSTVDEIAEFLSGYLNYNRTSKAINSIRGLNLVVVKRTPGGMDLLELHPLVRHFIRSTFSQIERVSFIDRVLRFYRTFIGRNKSRLDDRPTFTTLQYWTQTAELDIAASHFDEAFLTLAEACNSFISSPYSREFCRVTRILLNSTDWIEKHNEYRGFDQIFTAYVKMLSHLGEYPEVDDWLDKYAMTVLEKDSRYIQYCDLRCYSKWLRGDHEGAIVWGRMGTKLADSTGVDTNSELAHDLALAERDSGNPEVALTTFLGPLRLSDLIDPDEFDENVNSANYGNVGRCLQLMGQVEPVLVCYQKSAILLEKEQSAHSLMNQGYIRLWIGELLIAKKEYRLGLAFLRAAYEKWEVIAPPKVREVQKFIDHVKKENYIEFCDSPERCESVVKNWISGQPDLIE